MKKLLLILFVMIVSPMAFGQLSFGPKIGFATGKLSTDLDTLKTEANNSFEFGAFVRLGKKLYIQPEVTYITKGGVFKNGSVWTQEVKLNTVEMSLLVGTKLMDLVVGNIRIMAGPSVNKVVKKDVKITGLINEADKILDDNLEDMIWNVNAGVGVDVLMFTLDVRYQIGLNEVIEKVNSRTYGSKNNMFKVSLGWKIL